MAEYYLISQLPSLDGLGETTPLPITEERFLELCERFLGESAFSALKALTLTPSREQERSPWNVVNGWNEGERNLRLVLAKIRGEKLNKTFSLTAEETANLPAGLGQTARTVVEMDNPLEAEKFLHHYRLQFLETLRPMDTFSGEFVFYYWLKLKLLLRIRQFDTVNGESAYKNIYDAIMNGDNREESQ